MEKRTMGAFISSLRKANGYTQADLAEMLGVSNKTISSWETNNSTPDLSILPAIADIFNVSIDELIRGEKKASNINLELSQKSEKIRNNMIKSLKNNYNNKFNISIGLILGAIVLIMPSTIINHISTIIFFIIGFLLYIVGIIFSNISFNNAKAKINDNEDNSEYLRFIYKRKLLLQCMYSFFILSPLFCFLMNNRFKNDQDFKATEEDISNLKFNFKLKRKLYIISGIIAMIGIIVMIILKNIPPAFFNQRFDFNEEINNNYTLNIEHEKGDVFYVNTTVNNISYRCEILSDTEKTENIPLGTYKFDIFYGNKDELNNIQNFEQYGFNIIYSDDKQKCTVYYENKKFFEYNLKVTNRDTAFYSVSDEMVYEFFNNKISYYSYNDYGNGSNKFDVIIIIVEAVIVTSMIIIYFSKRKNILN